LKFGESDIDHQAAQKEPQTINLKPQTAIRKFVVCSLLFALKFGESDIDHQAAQK
jgi:hypothetical protein